MNRAQRCLDHAQSRPTDVVVWCRELLDDQTASPIELASAQWALGRAFSELARIDEACDSLAEGMAIAEQEGLSELGAEIRVSLSVCLLRRGDTSGARSQLVAAERSLTSRAARGRLRVQQGLLHLYLGSLDEAVSSFDEAESLLSDGDDALARIRTLINRGMARSMMGELAKSEVDLRAAQDAAAAAGQHMLQAGAAQNLGFVEGRRGDIFSALRAFETARRSYAEVGSPPRAMVTLELDYCAVLLGGGLYVEAIEAGRRAANLANRAGIRLEEAEALLLVARVHLADGAFVDAEREATAAARLFAESDRRAWVAVADYIALSAAAGITSEPDGDLMDRALRIIAELEANGWHREALDVQTFAGRLALRLGQADRARQLLSTVEARRQRGSSVVRADAWLATAALRLAEADRDGARQACSTGMEILEQHRLSLGSTELRANASINAAELAELGLRLALEADDATDVLSWAERWHAGGMRISSPRPNPSGRLAAAMSELREVHARSPQAGAVDPDEDIDLRVGRLEREIRRLARVEGAPDPATALRLDDQLLVERLGLGCLVEYFRIGPTLGAVTVCGGELRTHELGPIVEVATEVRKLTSALGRLAYGQDRRGAVAARLGLATSADLLQSLLISPLGLEPSHEVVVVPTGPLQAMPWAVLPSFDGVAVTVTPSGTGWSLRAAETFTPPERAVLVCGPDLPGAPAEIARIRQHYRNPVVLQGGDATVEAFCEAVVDAEIVHVAAHGMFRADNPMFSSLLLHDGPLTVYDIESLAAGPTTVILSACDAARSAVRHGDELLGTAAALLQVGVMTVVAPVTVVPDSEAVSSVMDELHRQLRAGHRPHQALAMAQADARDNGQELGEATAASFVAIGP